MIGLIIVELARTYVPIFMALVYFYSFDRILVENLLKFFVLRTIISSFSYFLGIIFPQIEQYFIIGEIPLYIYLSIYSYAYSSFFFDVLAAPFMNIFVEYHLGVVAKVEKQKKRMATIEEYGKGLSQKHKPTSCLSWMEITIFKVFQMDNFYLIK